MFVHLRWAVPRVVPRHLRRDGYAAGAHHGVIQAGHSLVQHLTHRHFQFHFLSPVPFPPGATPTAVVVVTKAEAGETRRERVQQGRGGEKTDTGNERAEGDNSSSAPITWKSMFRSKIGALSLLYETAVSGDGNQKNAAPWAPPVLRAHPAPLPMGKPHCFNHGHHMNECFVRLSPPWMSVGLRQRIYKERKDDARAQAGRVEQKQRTRMQSCGAKSGSSGRRTVRTFLSAKLAFLPEGNFEACVVKLTLSPPEVISNWTYGCATA